MDTAYTFDYRPGKIESAIAQLDAAGMLIGHNILRHDLPLLKRLHKWSPRPGVVIRDTLVCARLIYPNIKDTDQELAKRDKLPSEYIGKHSIGAWGHRLGNPKGDYAQIKRAEALSLGITDEEAILRYTWGQWSEEMQEYMLQDVDTNYALWKYLDVDNYSQQAIELEHRIAIVCDQMNRAGVPFDVQAASKLHAELIQKRDEIEKHLVASFGSWYQPISPNPEKAVFTPKKDSKKLGYLAGAPMTKLKLVTFNPGSRDHIARVLLAKGWKPEKMTDGGKPQIDEETVAGVVARYPELAGLGEYLTIEKRLSQLADGKQAWLQVCETDGKTAFIHGVCDPMGTTTSRAAHFKPNMGQVPAVKSPYGKECRSLFYAPPGWTMIGADMSGLELRGLAHYLAPLDEGAYAKTVLEGDPHWVHAVAMGLAEGERDKHNQLHTILREDGSKRFIYAYIYGCGNGKAGEIIFSCLDAARRSGPAGESLFARWFPSGANNLDGVGKRVRTSFANRITGFNTLKGKLSNIVAEEHALPGLDGRWVPVRSEHSALNFLIQSAGAILCKRWVCDAFDGLCARFNYDWENPWNGDFVIGLWVHDEIQVWVREGLEEEASKIITEAARRAGEPYGFRVRLDSEAKTGRSWAETH